MTHTASNTLSSTTPQLVHALWFLYVGVLGVAMLITDQAMGEEGRNFLDAPSSEHGGSHQRARTRTGWVSAFSEGSETESLQGSERRARQRQQVWFDASLQVTTPRGSNQRNRSHTGGMHGH